jgi:hypothetical protein
MLEDAKEAVYSTMALHDPGLPRGGSMIDVYRGRGRLRSPIRLYLVFSPLIDCKFQDFF